MSRLEEIKNQLEESNSYDDNPNGYWYHNIKWLIQQAEVSKEWQIVANNTWRDWYKAEKRLEDLREFKDDIIRELNKQLDDLHEYIDQLHDQIDELLCGEMEEEE